MPRTAGGASSRFAKPSARPESGVVSWLLRSTLACVLAGLGAGVSVAVTAGRMLNLTLFETALANPWIIAAVCCLILGVSLVACAGPAARVARLDIRAELRAVKAPHRNRGAAGRGAQCARRLARRLRGAGGACGAARHRRGAATVRALHPNRGAALRGAQ